MTEEENLHTKKTSSFFDVTIVTDVVWSFQDNLFFKFRQEMMYVFFTFETQNLQNMNSSWNAFLREIYEDIGALKIWI